MIILHKIQILLPKPSSLRSEPKVHLIRFYHALVVRYDRDPFLKKTL